MTDKKASQPIISLGYDKAPDGTYTATMTVSGLLTEEQAAASLDHMERLFCGSEVQQKEIQ